MRSTAAKNIRQEKELADTKTYDASASLSYRLYGLDWRKHFPVILNGGEIEVRYGTPQVGLEFYKSHYSEIFNPEGQVAVLNPKTEKAKLNYYKEAGDFFEFYYKQQLIGIFVGTPIDWSSYYFRNIAILPGHQGKRIGSQVEAYLIEVLKKYPIERIEGDVSATNARHMQILSKLNFIVTGVKFSDRWGGLIQLTRFLSEEQAQ